MVDYAPRTRPPSFSPTGFATFLLSDLVQILHTSATHHYLGSFFYYFLNFQFFSVKTLVFCNFLVSVPSDLVEIYTHILLICRVFFFAHFPTKTWKTCFFYYISGHFFFYAFHYPTVTWFGWNFGLFFQFSNIFRKSLILYSTCVPFRMELRAQHLLFNRYVASLSFAFRLVFFRFIIELYIKT